MITTAADLLVPLSLLQPSATNPRTRIGADALRHLGDSIREHEVIQAILARPIAEPVPHGPTLEIVAGERRWRACQALGEENPHRIFRDLPDSADEQTPRPAPVAAIPCIVRALTDAQALALQLVENINREDLHPLEEAEHYRRMRDDAQAPASVEDIARIAKVSESRVYERLALLHLVPEAREAFFAEKLNLKTALLVARMPPQQHPEIVAKLADWGGEPMGAKAAAAFIRSTFMLRLATALFDAADAQLVPAAGACTTCPKRSGANPRLFADITDEDTCTDRECFAAKRAASRAELVDKMRTTGYQVLEGEAARSACTPDGRGLRPGLVALEAQVPAQLGDATRRVCDVLAQANVPNSDVQAIDHPLALAVTLAVAEGRLQSALRRIGAHREERKPASTKAPAAAGVAKSAADAANALAQPAAPTAASQPHRGTGAEASPWPAADSPREAVMRELLSFDPPPEVYARKNAGAMQDGYRQDREAEAHSILAGVLASSASVGEQRATLSRPALTRLLLLLMSESSLIPVVKACALAGVNYPVELQSHDGMPYELRTARYGKERHWLWTLPSEDAERLVPVLYAAQEGGLPSEVFDEFAPLVLHELGLDASELKQRAAESVAQQLQLGAMKHGVKAKPEPADGVPKAKARKQAAA